MKFHRIGGLTLIKQTQYRADVPSFHSPPVRKGLYAFPVPYFEWFLLGGKWGRPGQKHAKFEYRTDKKGDKILWQTEFDKIIDQRKRTRFLFNTFEHDGFIIVPKRIRVFDFEGEIWHHLGENVKPGQIIQKKGDWYLSIVDDYEEMFKKEEHMMLRNTAAFMGKYDEKIDFSNLRSHVTIDHMEVFISEKI